MIFLLNKYRNLSAPVKASFWFIISSVMLRGISFITLPIFSRLMTTSQYGIVSVYHSWVAIVSIFSTLTIWGGVFNVVLTRKADEKEKYIASFQGLSTTLTFFFLCITVIFNKYLVKISGLNTFLLILMFINIFSTTPFYLWTAKERFEYKYKKLVVISIITSILNPLISYFVVINTDYKAEGRILVDVGINAILGAFFFFINIKNGKCYFNKEIWAYAFEFNVVLIPHYLALQILSQSDRLMINNYCGSGEAGIYSVAYSFAMLLTLITGGLDSSVTPYIYNHLKKNDLLPLKKNITLLIFGIAGIAVFVSCLIPDFFKIMLPESYYSAIWVIPPVITAVYFMFLYPMFCSIEYYFEKTKYASISTLISAGINIILNYIFIKLYGFIAAAYTTLFCYILLTIFHYVAMRFVLKKNGYNENVFNIKMILLISILFLAIMLGITLLYKNCVLRWCIISVTFIICMLFHRRIIQTIKNIRSSN